MLMRQAKQLETIVNHLIMTMFCVQNLQNVINILV